MMSPRRLFHAWLDLRQLEERRREVESQLEMAFRQPVLLEPANIRTGCDRLFHVRTRRWKSRILACVRMNVPSERIGEPEAGLPRIPLPPAERIARELQAYHRLAPHGLTPRLLARGPVFLANHWLPWPRLSDVLKRDPMALWSILPRILDAVRRMHSLGLTHLDLNCGNILVAADYSRIALIDFEYGTADGISAEDEQRFDFLRLAHNLLKPRRGRSAAFRDPAAFVTAFSHCAVANPSRDRTPFSLSGIARIFDHPTIGSELSRQFGIDRHHLHDEPATSLRRPRKTVR